MFILISRRVILILKMISNFQQHLKVKASYTPRIMIEVSVSNVRLKYVFEADSATTKLKKTAALDVIRNKKSLSVVWNRVTVSVFPSRRLIYCSSRALAESFINPVWIRAACARQFRVAGHAIYFPYSFHGPLNEFHASDVNRNRTTVAI